MKHLDAADFERQCRILLDRMDPEGVIITKNGEPVAKLVSISNQQQTLIGSLKGKLTIRGNIMSTGVRWDAES